MEQNDLNQTPMGDHSEESIKAESNLVSEQTIQAENQVESMPVSEVVDNIADTTFELHLEPEPEEEEISSTDLDSASGVPTMDVDVSYIDYSGLTKFELIQKFKQLLSEGEITYLRNEIENLKVNFYKKHKA